MSLILSRWHAEGVYNAMCALNNVGGRAKIEIDNPSVAVLEYPSGSVHVLRGMGGVNNSEVYESQCDFAKAYGLQQD